VPESVFANRQQFQVDEQLCAVDDVTDVAAGNVAER
jgi:hypothetical protein